MAPLNEDGTINTRELKLELLPKLDANNDSLLVRDIKFEVKADAKSGIIEGYASTFGNWDSYNDIIRAGAFSRSIAEKHAGFERSKIKFLWQHDRRQVLGLAAELREDSHGLYFEGKVVHPGELGRVALTLAAEGAIDAFSIGFNIYPGGAKWLELEDLSEAEKQALLANNSLDDLFWMPPREFTAIDLKENSLVTWGANPLALIEGVKSYFRTMVPGWRPEAKEPVAEATPAPAPAPEPAPTEAPVAVISERGGELHLHFKSVEEVEAFAKSWGGGSAKLTHPAPNTEDKDDTQEPRGLATLADSLKGLREALLGEG